ncbi:sugar ABC transporter permease [Rhizocola hellebori]|uniref:Sugar ABC transporter permease n=1 Tax=Rhizocola hellebori TaxID=1392758 RepID=A0A8J3Q9F5_9ACTN|nr:carbohydrate ABC transporter permease [Rhizocola hellebori]GIH06375.1 sugar ABC transporter permease [Rhizocola hellebori]
MSTVPVPVAEPATAVGRVRKRLTSRTASAISLVIALIWTVPTLGLFISSFRPEADIKTNGWWNFFTDPKVTLDNYQDVLFGTSGSSGRLATYFINSLVITIPSVLFPVAFCALAAYALAWTKFKGRDWIYVAIFALQIVPIQMALVPLLQFFNIFALEDEGSFVQIWFAHTCFAIPLGVFLLHNFMSELPGDIIEAARVDGASHARIFRQVVLPLIVPALASFAIFQFLWVWNDLLVALVFVPGADSTPLTVRLAELAGTRGNDWQRLTSGAFVSIIIPLIVFLSLQRYFVRGLLAGSVKG